MCAVRGKAAAYSKACRTLAELDARVLSLRSELIKAEELQRRAQQELNRTQRELLEEAKLT